MVAAPIEALGPKLVNIEPIRGRTPTLRIYTDNEDDINVDDCIDMNRQVSAVLNVGDPVTITYNLEVSSLGLNRLLFTAEHYARFVGERATLVLHMVVQNRRKWQSVIKTVDGGMITIAVESRDEASTLNNIQKTSLVSHF